MTPKSLKAWKIVVAAIGIVLSLTVVLSPAFGQAAKPLQYGQPATGALAASQKIDFTFVGKTGDKLTIDMTVTDGEIDPLVSLYDPQGRLIGENDNGGGKRNAHLAGLVLPRDGAYRLTASNLNKNGAGQYSLIILRETAKGAIYFDGKPGSVEKYQLSQPWDHTHITYRIENTLSQFNAQDVKNVIKQALQAWANVTPLTFQEVSSGSSDIDIKFGRIDGALNILGETCPPSSPCSGQVQLDSEEPWTLGAPQSYDDISLLGVASHELGHAIGLLHSSDASALMYPAYSPYNLKPAGDDIRGAQRLYGAGQGGVANNPTAVPSNPNNNNGGQEQVTGTITNAKYVNFWDFDVNAGESVTITMKHTSGDLDPFLVLLDANNKILASDDDSAGNRDAQFSNVRLPKRGTYTVAATRAEQAQGHTTGKYTLTIEYNTTGGNGAAAPTTAPQGGGSGSVSVSKGQGQVLPQGSDLDETLDTQFTDSLTPDTQTSNATVQASQTYIWALTWCATDDATLTKNLPSLA